MTTPVSPTIETAAAPYHFSILSLFPEMLHGYLNASILSRAQKHGLVTFDYSQIRDFATGKHRVCDDSPYGGGGGMVMKAGPIVEAIEAAKQLNPNRQTLLMTPAGERLTTQMAQKFAETSGGLILVCGRYEGIDDRVNAYVDREISIGDFVLTGGELPALAVVDAVSRFLPGVLGNEQSPYDESLAGNLLEYPHFTRPATFRGVEVPPVLLCGDHAKIAAWRRDQSIKRTADRRPDLLAGAELTNAERRALQEQK